MYKVFHNHRAIYFSENIPEQIADIKHLHFGSQEVTEALKAFLEADQGLPIWVQTLKSDEEFERFCNNFKLMEAAGGLVKNPEDYYLFIFRLGKWDLPKGKIEKGEKATEAAIREVEEECGVSQVNILRELPDTWHIYNLKNQWILKKTHWFEMFCSDWQNPTPQLEEDILSVEWKSIEMIQDVLSNTYSSISDLIVHRWPSFRPKAF